jgi:hypothetical protein
MLLQLYVVWQAAEDGSMNEPMGRSSALWATDMLCPLTSVTAMLSKADMTHE